MAGNRFVAIAAMAAGLAACSEHAPAPGFVAGSRRVQEVTDTVTLVGGVAEDTALFMPTMVAFAGEGIAVGDRDRSQGLFFGRDGTPRWRYGARGSGPGEFAGVTQMSADEQGRLWLLDPDNVRISILDSDGALVRAFPVPDVGFADRLVPIGGGHALLMGLDPMIHVIDEYGGLVSSTPHPYAGYASLHPLSAYNRAVYDPRTDSTAFFFYYGGGFARTNDALTQTTVLDPYIEPIPFPEVSVQRTEGADGSVSTASSVQATRLAARSGAADHGVLHLVFEGDTEYGGRLIDRYSIGSGAYLGSWLLPDTVRGLAVSDGLVATLVHSPVPALVVRHAPGG